MEEVQQYAVDNIRTLYHLARDPDQDDAFHQAFPDCLACISGLPEPFLNAIWVGSIPEEKLYSYVEQLVAYFRSADLPFSWIVTPNTQPHDLAISLLGHGFSLDKPLQCWQGVLAELQPSKDVELDIRQVEDDEVFDDWTETFLGEECFGPSTEVICERWGQMGFAEDCPLQHFICYIDHIPTATASVLIQSGHAGLYHLVVEEEAKDQGIEEAMMAYQLQFLATQGVETVSAFAPKLSSLNPLLVKVGLQQHGQLEIARY